MSSITSPTARGGSPMISVPSGGSVLCQRQQRAGPAVAGSFEFRGETVRIEVPDPTSVLFPSDVGMSLLGAIADDPMLDITGLRVLDVGAGSGVYSIAMLAAGAAEVTALDVNPACEGVIAANAALTGVDPGRIEFVRSDLADYRPSAPFDLVVSNPPHFPYDPVYARRDGLEVAAVGGGDGRALYDILIDRADGLLTPDGVLLLAHSSLTDVQRTCRDLGAAHYRCRIVGVWEMDIPLLAYESHRDELMANLQRLREQGRAEFEGARFCVHTLAFSKTGGGRAA